MNLVGVSADLFQGCGTGQLVLQSAVDDLRGRGDGDEEEKEDDFVVVEYLST